MKKVIFSLCFCILGLSVFAQNTSDKALSASIDVFNKAKTSNDLVSVKGDFVKQINASSDWRPTYYAALATLKQAELHLRENKIENVDKLANEATDFLQPILQFNTENSEIRALMAFVHIVKMAKNSSDFESERKKAKELLYLEVNSDPSNPRFDLLRAQLQYLSLKNMKMDKDFKAGFQNAAKLLKDFKPKNSNDPTWGLEVAQYYISILK